MPVLGPEGKIQSKVVQYARDRGAVAIKLTSVGLGTAGWPDYLFLYDSVALFVEFKAPGEKPTSLQAQRHKQLADRGFPPFVADNVEQGRELLDRVFGW